MKISTSHENIENSSVVDFSLQEEFKKQAIQLSAILASEGIKVSPFFAGLPYFRKLTVQDQHEVIRSIRLYTDLCVEQIEEGYKLRDSTSFTWRAIRKFGLLPVSDLFNYISDEDIIEIYNNENRQMFRNLRYYDYCSYTLEELYSVEWWHLFSRENEITEQLLKEVTQVLSGEIKGVLHSSTAKHLVKELNSLDRLSNFYKAKLLSPLYVNKRIDAFIVTIAAESIDAFKT